MLADKFDFGFAVDWMRKDLGLCLAEARAQGAALPVTALVDQFYARVQAQGGGRWDSSSLIRVLRDRSVASRGRRGRTHCGGRHPIAVDDRDLERDLGGLREHQRRRAVLVLRQLDRALDLLRIESVPGHRVAEVDLREHLGIGGGPLGVGVDAAVGDRLPRLLQDQHDVEGGAGRGSEQHHLHRPHAPVAASVFRRAVDHDRRDRCSDSPTKLTPSTHFTLVFIALRPMCRRRRHCPAFAANHSMGAKYASAHLLCAERHSKATRTLPQRTKRLHGPRRYANIITTRAGRVPPLAARALPPFLLLGRNS